MLLYAISDRRLFSGDEQTRRAALIEQARRWARGGVDYLQIREKDLNPADLRELAAKMVNAVRAEGAKTRVLVNGPAEIALAAGADGVHLPGGMPKAAVEEARRVFAAAGREAVISRACHSVEEVRETMEEVREAGQVAMIVFAPVFEKVENASAARPGVGLEALSAACRAAAPLPVIALGGVSFENARSCVEAGAAGVAAIRLFLGEEWRELR